MDCATQLFAVFIWSQNLQEPTAVSPPTARTAAFFVQAPAQDPHSCSSTSMYAAWLQLCLVHTVVRRCCDCCEFGNDYKCPDSTQLNSNEDIDELDCCMLLMFNDFRLCFIDYPAICWYCIRMRAGTVNLHMHDDDVYDNYERSLNCDKLHRE